MTTRTKPSDYERDLELENIVGNLLIAQYQVDKLRARLGERVGGYGSAGNRRDSTQSYVHNEKRYGIDINVRDMGGAVEDDGGSATITMLTAKLQEVQNDYRNEARRSDALQDKLGIARRRIEDMQEVLADLKRSGVDIDDAFLKFNMKSISPQA